ncbi:MAG: hypothetical protein K6G42_05190 [Lachnospiraceae bacterium]|nr:hypothetical protein [Lachnospiraceae bacterium]
MITEKALYGINYYRYGEPYFGSDEGMRFRLAREPLKDKKPAGEDEKPDPPKLRAEVWFGRLSYENTPEEEITSEEFEFSEAGFSEAVKWMNEKHP